VRSNLAAKEIKTFFVSTSIWLQPIPNSTAGQLNSSKQS